MRSSSVPAVDGIAEIFREDWDLSADVLKVLDPPDVVEVKASSYRSRALARCAGLLIRGRSVGRQALTTAMQVSTTDQMEISLSAP